MRLSVVVPSLEEEAHLPLLLEALAAEPPGERPDEVVVADGGSRDRTLAVARRAGARLVASAPGRGTQLAAGARAASGELLVFLHADTRPAPGALLAVRELFAERPSVAAAGMRQRIDARGRLFRWIERAADRRVRRGRVFGDSGLCVRRSAYDAAGGFRDLPLFEDVDLSRRLRRAGEVRLVEAAVLLVSARRWEREGALRATARNWALRAGFAAGVEPRRLIRYYSPPGGPSR